MNEDLKFYIKNKINLLELELSNKKSAYSDLNQIDMLSGIGNSLNKEINEITGKIKAYKDILNFE